MKPIEIVVLIRESNPKLLGKMPDAKAAKIVAAAFHQVGKQLTEAESGAMKFGGLGVFGVRKVERQKEGQTITAKKINFRMAKGKVKKAAAE